MQLQLLHYITLYNTTLHYTNYITLHYIYNCNYNYIYHYIALRYTTLITIHHNYNYTTLHYARLHYTIPHYSTQHYSTLQYTTLITPHHNLQLQLQCTNYITLELQLTTTTPLRFNYNYKCTTPYYIRQLWWGDHCNHRNYSKNTTPTTFRSISGFALPSVIHNNQPLL